MNIMKLLGVILLAISFTKCASAKFENQPPFTITNASVNDTNQDYSELRVDISKNDEVNFQDAYYNGKKTKIVLQNKGNTIVAKFEKEQIIRLNDLQLHADPKKEFGNTLLKRQDSKNTERTSEVTNFPFKLNNNEAVLSYLIAEKMKYVKVKNVKK